MLAERTDARENEFSWPDFLPFTLVHVAAIAGVLYYGWSWTGFALSLAIYGVLMFAITAFLHRYFSHRSYKTSRPFQFVMALMCTLTSQRGVLWWAAHHRHHHKYSDQPEDSHSPLQRGFLWSHCGWIFSRSNNPIKWEYIKDLAQYPELRWLQKYEKHVTVALAIAMLLIGGMWGLLWGFFVMTVMLWHGTFTINSFTHLWGRRRYKTTDDSRNSLLFALITHGEGWHNNHHYYQRCASQGFYWWEIDVSYYLLKMLSWVGLVSDVNRPPKHIRDARPIDTIFVPHPKTAPRPAQPELHKAA